MNFRNRKQKKFFKFERVRNLKTDVFLSITKTKQKTT